MRFKIANVWQLNVVATLAKVFCYSCSILFGYACSNVIVLTIVLLLPAVK